MRQIEIFYHVYREGSISAAARKLFVSQPSVSKVLRHAEDQLGLFLFERRKGGHLRVGVLPSLGFAVAPPMVAQVRKEDPHVTFDLATLHSDEVSAARI